MVSLFLRQLARIFRLDLFRVVPLLLAVCFMPVLILYRVDDTSFDCKTILRIVFLIIFLIPYFDMCTFYLFGGGALGLIESDPSVNGAGRHPL